MNWLQKLLNKFNGLHYSQEYLCLGQETFEQPLHAYLVADGQVIKDITKQHLFVGYHPLLLALSAQDTSQPVIEIVFTNRYWQPNEVFSQKDALARLRLQQLQEQAFRNQSILLYEGLHGQHKFVSPFHQYIIGLNNRLFQKKPGNVFLHDNLYKQVQVAYALPRNVSLITVGKQNSFNLFPTDLHGPFGAEHYIISLRHQGKACRQVTEAGKLLISQVSSQSYKTVYQLGKNHMQDMKPKDNFRFSGSLSLQLQLPVPESALSYRELELQDYFNHGIHKLMLFKVLGQQIVAGGQTTLAHIHQVYASWRHNNRLPGNYLLR